MLVMRNFGWLGLQSVVNMKSSLARDRLVDFTGDFQLRRKTEDQRKDEIEKDHAKKSDDDGGRVTVVPPWQPDFVTEPTQNGGRNIARLEGGKKSSSGKKGTKGSPKRITSPTSSSTAMPSSLPLYSQELAPIPLSFTPPSGRSGSKLPGASSSSTSMGEDAEISFHTAF